MCSPEPSSRRLRQKGLPLSIPADVVEEAGKRVTATVDGRRVIVGAGRLSSDAPPWANLPVFDDFRPYSGRVVTKYQGVAGERRDCAGACRARRISYESTGSIAWDFLGSEFAEQIHADWPMDRRVLGATPLDCPPTARFTVVAIGCTVAKHG
jgi:hypothetical protein